MNRSDMPKEILGGSDGTARCPCGRLRYPRYKLCPKCYYAQKEGSSASPPEFQRQHQSTAQDSPSENLANLSTAELLQMRAPMRMPLPDRHERIHFLEQKHGKTFRGKEIRFMKNSQLYAISQQAGYRR